MNIKKIEVVEHRSEWKNQFKSEKKILKNTLDKILISIHHIGSTSVIGLCAKPIIDILLEVTDLDEVDLNSHKMKTLGYIPKGEFGIKGRRYFQKSVIERTHQIHAFEENDSNVKRHIAFRDYLRVHPNVKSEYGSIKTEAMLHCNNDLEKYMNYKNNFIKHFESKAIIWFDSINNK